MANPKGSTPPVNTSETNKLQGVPISTVEIFGLQSVIRKMKARPKDYGDMAIATEINETILKDSEEKISHMAVYRWWKKHKNDEEPDTDMVNIYGSHLESLKSINKQLEMIEMYLGNLNDSVSNVDEVVKVSKIVTELTATFDKLTMRKSALLGTIGDIQAKVYTYANFETVLRLIMDTVAAKDAGLHHEIVQAINKDPMLTEVVRKIKEHT